MLSGNQAASKLKKEKLERKAFKQNSWNWAPAVTYRIKENRKAIAILKIDDFLHVNSSLTLLIGVWSMFAGLPPSDFMRAHAKGQFSRVQKFSRPRFKSICL